MTDLAALARAEKARRVMAKRHLKDFISYTFPGYRRRPHNELICDAIDLCVYGIIERLVINCPPQYGKSEVLSRKTPPYYLGKFPDRRVILASYAATLATDLSRNARDLIESPLYQNIFGSMSSSEDPIALSEESRSVHSWNIGGHRGGMTAAGMTGGLPGKSADFLIIDDPLKDDIEAASENTREQQFNQYWGVLHTRLSPHAPVILTQTRWHEEDLSGKLLKQAPDIGELWYVLRLPAVAETEEEMAHWCELHKVDEEHWLTREKVDEMLEGVTYV